MHQSLSHLFFFLIKPQTLQIWWWRCRSGGGAEDLAAFPTSHSPSTTPFIYWRYCGYSIRSLATEEAPKRGNQSSLPFCKGLNRGCATLLAGALGVGGQHFATAFGERGEPIVLRTLVFILAAGSTFFRFLPKIKAIYDYGVMIFILTFSLVTVLGYRVEQLFELAHQRLSTILIGAATCMIISIFVCPVWTGEDIHNLVAFNIEKLANYLKDLKANICNA